jgi:hypothetical protein
MNETSQRCRYCSYPLHEQPMAARNIFLGPMNDHRDKPPSKALTKPWRLSAQLTAKRWEI